MPLSRAECANMNDTMLQVSIDGCVHRIRGDWSDGRPGKLTDIYDLAVLRAEYELRVGEVCGPMTQLRLIEDGPAAA